MKEIWKKINGYHDYYIVSNMGNVKSNYSGIWKYKKKYYDWRGYTKYQLMKNGKRTIVFAHRLVLNAFIGESILQCNHKNGIKSDNTLENLEWVTQSENQKHAIKLGLKKILFSKGNKCAKSKISDNDVFSIRKMNGTISQKKIAASFNISQSLVSQIVTGKRRSISI